MRSRGRLQLPRNRVCAIIPAELRHTIQPIRCDHNECQSVPTTPSAALSSSGHGGGTPCNADDRHTHWAGAHGWGRCPLLSRLYASADLGTYGFFVGVVGILAICSSGQLWMAINIARDEREADALLGAGVLVACCFSLVTAAFVPVLERELPSLVGYGWLLPGATLFTGIQLSLSGWLNRRKRFARISASHVIRAGCLITVQTGFALILPTPFGLIAAQLLSLFVVSAFLARRNRSGGQVPSALAARDVCRRLAPLGLCKIQCPSRACPCSWSERGVSHLRERLRQCRQRPLLDGL